MSNTSKTNNSLPLRQQRGGLGRFSFCKTQVAKQAQVRPAYTNTAYLRQSGGFITRGFTGHEHLPQFNLINMNGRLYDPTIGRMLSPDKYVQDPTHTQSYNRYSYVQNNPLKYTDPSGWILKAAPEKDISVDTHSGGGGGGGNIGYVGDLNSITGMGSFGYNYMGPYSAYASNPGGYAATYGTTANWVTSVHQSSN